MVEYIYIINYSNFRVQKMGINCRLFYSKMMILIFLSIVYKVVYCIQVFYFGGIQYQVSWFCFRVWDVVFVQEL